MMATMKRMIMLAIAASLAFAGAARAQDTDYPTRPVRVIVPYPAGGLVDLITRVVTERMAASLGQPFTIESRAGANGTIATASVAHADPDGYTLLMITDSHGVNPLFYKSLSYDSVKDFAPIGLIAKSPMVLTVHVSVPARTVAELIALARAEPGKLTYGSIGVGSASHLAGELFKVRAGVDLTHVPYRGGAPAVNDLIAGHLKTMFLTPVSGLPHIRSGRLAPLAIAAPQRFELMPEVPTMAEAGVPLEAAYWVGMAAPAATPRAAIARLEKALSAAVAAPETQKRLTEMGAVVTPLSAAEFGAYIRADLKSWADFVTQAKIKLE
jgi:tripartite-type tricarboxylate transporter receptor subunit TctC